MCFQVSATFTLWLISFLAYAVQFMLLSNLNIAITDMIMKPTAPNATDQSVINQTLHPETEYNAKEMKFHWNEAQQSTILGGVYWILWLSHIIGGILAHKFGAKIVMGFSIFIASTINLFMPWAVLIHYRFLTLLRIVQGYVLGLAFPAIIVIVPHWIPKNHRASFLTCYLGISFGNAVTYLVSGFIIEFFRWKGVFYFTGVVGIIWCVACKFFMFDKPQQHPRISEKEKRDIESKLKTEYNEKLVQFEMWSKKTKRKPVPWFQILTSVRVLSNFLNQFGLLWSIFTISIYTPRYLKFFFNLSSGMTGVFSGLPHLCRVLGAILIILYTDRLIQKNILSATTVRRLSTFISNVVVGALFIVFAYFGDSLVTAIFITFAQLTFSGLAISGSLAAWVDVSRNFAGILQGFSGAFSHISGILIPITVGLTLNNDTVEQWRKIYLISGVISVLSGLPFILVWNSTPEKWDSEDEPKPEEYTDLKLEIK